MVVFDVGANDGTSCSEFLKDKKCVVYAFEPTPFLIDNYLKNYESNRYIIIPKAVSNSNGVIKLNVAGKEDWGCTSILDFSDDLEKTWPGRKDFVKTDEINVETIRLDHFCTSNNIDIIDYFHCDVQGCDLLVLEGLGEKIGIIQYGQVEVFVQNPLYKGATNSYGATCNYLKNKGFVICGEKADACGNEYNLFFRNKSIKFSIKRLIFDYKNKFGLLRFKIKRFIKMILGNKK